MTVPTPPALRTVATACLTEAGWIRGTFHVPLQQSFSDYLQNSGAFLPMTDVVLPRGFGSRAFFAVQRDDIRLAVPNPSEANIETITGRGFTSPWSVTCLLPDGLLDGQIDFLTNQRLSDHLRIARGYLVVREAAWQPAGPGDGDAGPGPEPCPVVLVNVARLVGIAEAETQRGHGHPGRYHTTASDYEIG
jgi:hypothetical protein